MSVSKLTLKASALGLVWGQGHLRSCVGDRALAEQLRGRRGLPGRRHRLPKLGQKSFNPLWLIQE